MICLIIFAYIWWMASAQEKAFENIGNLSQEDFNGYMQALCGKDVSK